MKSLLLICCLCLTSVRINAQQLSFNKQWDVRFGGVQSEGANAFQLTRDSGYIIGGTSNSPVSGNKTQPNWDTTLATNDYWVVKLDAVGNKLWDRRFGGTDEDELFALQQCDDGGYIFCGTTFSGNNGDITQPPFGGGDYWVIRTDSLGNKLWDKRFGGAGMNYLYAGIQTRDGGFIMGGLSNSPVSGNKTLPDWDGTGFSDDFWVVKIDSNGSIQWEGDYGGTNEDELFSILQTPDGGYLLGGTSESDSSGDKTQDSFGFVDYWVVKIDSVGIVQWEGDYGGTDEDELNSLIATRDGGYLLGGLSFSGQNGDKTSADGPYWIVKIDSVGHKQWDSGFGLAQVFYNVIQTQDGGYLMSGYSASDSGEDKTENNLGTYQDWLVKTDSLGRKQWDKTIFTFFSNTGYITQTIDGCYVMGGGSSGGIGGYKSQNNWGADSAGEYNGDFWIIKFCEGPTAINEITNNLQFNVYPNPFTSELDITLTQQNLHQATFTITNLLGQTIYSQQENNLSPTYTKMLDLSYLANGVYLVSVVVNGEKMVREVVKQ